MKRLLALEGGGLRVFFTVQVLERVEQHVRARLGRPDAVLADYFDLIAGTSTGAILGAFLSWGLSVAEIKKLYAVAAASMFTKNSSPLRWVTHRYAADALSKFLRDYFVEERESIPAELGTSRLRTTFLAVVRNATTGSAWPLCNHSGLKFNAPALEDCNLRIPLWRIVRASAAAPTFFEPERIQIGKAEFQFIDGGVTPYNNPALIAALIATEAGYGIGWPAGEDCLHLVSVGTGRTRVKYTGHGRWDLSIPVVAQKTIGALIEGVAHQQDLLCRVLGRCIYGPIIDTEVGDMIERGAESPLGNTPPPRRFTYVRYNCDFPEAQFAPFVAGTGAIPMDRPDLIPLFEEVGRTYAADAVQLSHLR